MPKKYDHWHLMGGEAHCCAFCEVVEKHFVPGEECECGQYTCEEHAGRCDSCGNLICAGCATLYFRDSSKGPEELIYCERCYKESEQ